MLGVAVNSVWLLAPAPVVALALTLALLLHRRHEVRRYERSFRARAEAKERGSHKARLQYPEIDLSRCIGCGACVAACPEEGVLDLMHGQAVVVHGARCVGHGRCAEVCPTNGIALTLGDLSERRDLPALTPELEAVGVPGLYIAGELSGFALVKTAVTQGTAACEEIAQSLGDEGPAPDGVRDLVIVGAGPAGLACALRAKELGLDFGVIEQADCIGGTVASYPRRKLVMTQPMNLPLHGKLPRLEYQKEELIELWQELVERHALPVRFGAKLNGLERADRVFELDTSAGPVRARRVVLALGRRGTPRKLGLPGEDLPKVAYSLLDAESYTHRRLLIVGGGDSAVEAAMGLAEQEGNEVTLSYRKPDFFRIKARNEGRIRGAIADGRVTALFETAPTEIREGEVVLELAGGERLTIANDEVFVFAGGEPPFGLLEKAGVSLDPADRPPPQVANNRGGQLIAAVSALLLGAIGMFVWAALNTTYYGRPHQLRPITEAHHWLRPAGPIGLTFGVLSAALFAWNLNYLTRRSKSVGRLVPGSLQFWMGTHVFTGLFSLLCVLVHAGFGFKNTVGGHALLALLIVAATGIVGRYFYAFIPRAANGRELHLEDLRSRLAALSGQWDRGSRVFGSAVRVRIDQLVDEARWRPSLFGRIRALVEGQVRLRRAIHGLRVQGRTEGIGADELQEVVLLARKAHRLTLQIAHFSEIRGLLAGWRYMHRWLALLMVLLVIAHVVAAWRYADLRWFGPPRAGVMERDD